MPVKEKSPPLGLRERNKIDKLRRIKAAARKLFVSRGYDETTTRDVAQAADVGLGTLFAYADNKRDLLFLVVNDELEAMIGDSSALVDPAATFIENFTKVLRAHYAYFADQPELSVILLRELQVFGESEQSQRFNVVIMRVVTLIASMIELAQKRGEIRRDEDPMFAAGIVFAIVRSQLRAWLGTGKLDVKAGIADLARAVNLLLAGLGTVTPSPRKPR